MGWQDEIDPVIRHLAAGETLFAAGDETREDLFQGVKQIHERGSKEFGDNSTPNSFVNGGKNTGALTIAEFDKILAPFLAGR